MTEITKKYNNRRDAAMYAQVANQELKFARWPGANIEEALRRANAARYHEFLLLGRLKKPA